MHTISDIEKHFCNSVMEYEKGFNDSKNGYKDFEALKDDLKKNITTEGLFDAELLHICKILTKEKLNKDKKKDLEKLKVYFFILTDQLCEKHDYLSQPELIEKLPQPELIHLLVRCGMVIVLSEKVAMHFSDVREEANNIKKFFKYVYEIAALGYVPPYAPHVTIPKSEYL